MAPEGTDFENPMQRSRKWQRRFFVLYEHGCLRFALDESPSTLPQGTINMNQCTDVIDAEPKTGQKNALCIVTPEQEYFIRGENKEIINGWLEQLIVYPKTNKQNQKKKRKVEATTSQEPGPAKVALTGSGIPEAERVPDSRSSLWQEEINDSGFQGHVFDVTGGDPVTPGISTDATSTNGDDAERSGLYPLQTLDSHALLPSTSSSSRYSVDFGGIPRCQSPTQSDPFPSGSSLLSNGSHISGSLSSLDSDASGSMTCSIDGFHTEFSSQRTSTLTDISRAKRLSFRDSNEPESGRTDKHTLPRSPGTDEMDHTLEQEPSRSTVIEKLEALELENAERMETAESAEESSYTSARQGRSETRHFQKREETKTSAQPYSFHPSVPLLRRAKSLDRRTTESVMTPDLLNFKKGWMVKLDEHGQWKKYWFVLTDNSLRYYKDSIAEEAADLDGEIDLSTCYNVTEYQVQRNYGFQIHTQEAMYTLSAMTAGIRRNWIQAIMKNVQPSKAPDVASLTDEQKLMPQNASSMPDGKQEPLFSETSSSDRERKSRARERRREGRSKTFDWAEFRPIAQAIAQQRALENELLFQPDLLNCERTKRREERRKRYEAVAGPLDSGSEEGYTMEVDGTLAVPSTEKQQKVQEEIEQQWQQVENTPLREERQVPLISVLSNTQAAELDKLQENHRRELQEVRNLLESCQRELANSHQYRQELEAQLNAALEREQQVRSGYISPATCERGFAAMEESHQKVIEELQRQHQRELEKLKDEKDRLLAEETAATIAAIEAMKNAHQSKLERELEKARKAPSNIENIDLEEIRRQHEEELASMHREIEVLSEQYSQKCLENAHLAQALEAERQALQQCQRENQDLNAHNQELNNRLATEITRLRSVVAGEGGIDGSMLTQGKDVYELEVLLRVKESEVQYLKQEINSLKDELQTAHRDKKYATDKYKDIYTELSIVKAKADRDISRLKEQLQLAHQALGERSLEDMDRGGYDIMKSKSNPDILKMATSKRTDRTMRSKSLKEGLTPDQKFQLFESKEPKEL